MPLTLAAVMAVASLALYAIPVLAPAIAADTGLSTRLVGPYSSAIWLAAIAGSAVAGRWIARFGPWVVAQACLAFCAAGLVLGAAGYPLALAMTALVVGFGQGLETPASSQLLTSHVPAARRAWLFSVKQSGVQVGAIVAAVTLPLLALAQGWRVALLVVAAACAVAAIALLPARRRWPAAPAVAAGGPAFGLWALLRAPGALRRLAFAAAAFGAMQISVNSFFVSFAVAERGDTLAQAGRWLAALQTGGLAGRLFWGWAASRYDAAAGMLRGLGIAMSACAVVLGAAGATLPPSLLLALAVVFGLTANGWNGIYLAEIVRLAPPSQSGAATGAVMIVMTAGLIGGPLLFAGLAALTSFSTAFITLALLSACGVLLLTGKKAT